MHIGSPTALCRWINKVTTTKTCRKCGETFPADLEHFYRNVGGKYGLTPRCKPCVNDDNAESHAKRLATDPERIRALANERSKKSYQKHLDKSRERHREHQAKRRADPELRRIINVRKRAAGAGITPKAYDALFKAQGSKCAICESTDPGSKGGWNLDHCHQSNTIRFILCAHCNRGLGAFRDDPMLMRKAADVLEAFYRSDPEE